MTYRIKATDDGYELVYGTRSAQVRIHERGGHGPLEKLYSVTERMSHMVRQGRTGINMSKESGVSLLLAADELRQQLETDLKLAGVLDS